MSAHETSRACAACLRRSWLLSAVSGPMDYCARDRERLLEALALADGELLKALAGRRAQELRARYASFPCDAGERVCEADVESICCHQRAWPRALAGRWAPRMLEVAGGARRLAALTSAPTVAILGSASASDYGLEMARSLARGLAASGVTVVASLTDGVAVAAHAGALETSGASVAVMGGGLAVACRARRRSLYARVRERGCAISELPSECSGRRWGQLASERTVVGLARVAIVVEADDTPADLFGARIAQARGRVLAAIPGRVSSPLSRGTNALLVQGAKLVRGAQDVLELLGPLGEVGMQARAGTARTQLPGCSLADLRPALRRTLERVGAGHDTPDRLAREGEEPSEALLALSELEVMGLLVRGDGGRYLLREPLDHLKRVVY